MVLLDLRDGGTDPARNGHANAIGVRRGTPASAAEAGCLPELIGERLELGAQPLDSAEIVAALGVLELLAQVDEPTPIGRPRLCVEHLTGIAEIADRCIDPRSVRDRRRSIRRDERIE